MSRRLDEVKDWETLARECHYKLDAIARSQGVSVRTLRRHFWQIFATAPKVWIDRVRAESIAKQIMRGDLVKTAAVEHHFKQRSHLTKLFKRITGKAPTKG